MIGPQLLEAFNVENRQDSLAIIGLVRVIRGTTASSLPMLSSEELLYPSRSAFVISTASPDGENEVDAARHCLKS